MKGYEKKDSVYLVKKIRHPIRINGDWNKKEWKKVASINLTHFMGPVPVFKPQVQLKMAYDPENIYLIFQVKDRFVRNLVEQFNGAVSTDACVEFFFAPDTSAALHYFNLEINAGGIPLMAYHIFPEKKYPLLTIEELQKIEIAHSLPAHINTEIRDSITWTIEYRLPLQILKKYGSVIEPKSGVQWRANFYKTSSKSSNPHWLTWSKVVNEKPNFHLPKFFGTILFE